MRNNLILLMCGLPRSGKTTYVYNSQEWSSEVCVSADRLRRQMYNRLYDQNNESMIWAVREVMLRYLMKQGTPIVIDETNTTRKRRRSIVGLSKEYGYEIIVVKVNTPVDICNRRAISGGRSDLLPVIDRMHREYEAPTMSEGFKVIIYVDYKSVSEKTNKEV